MRRGRNTQWGWESGGVGNKVGPGNEVRHGNKVGSGNEVGPGNKVGLAIRGTRGGRE